MGAIVNRYGAEAAAVMAVQAGADVVMMPVDPPQAIAAICQAVESGEIGIDQIRASVARIWAAKQKLFGTAPVTPPDALVLGSMAERGNRVVAEIERDSLQVRGAVPIATTGGINLIAIDEILDCPFLGRTAPAIVHLRERGYQCQILNKYTPPDFAIETAPVILQLFIRGNPFGGGLGITPLAQKICQELVAKKQLQALVIYGSPYLFQDLAATLPPAIPCIFSYGQMPSAQQTALDRLLVATPAVVNGDRSFTT
jgi:beta-glucosidase